MRNIGTVFLVIVALVVVLPAALGLTLYFSGPRLLSREIETPQLTPSQISQAETKINLMPISKEETLILNVTDLNALLQKGLSEEPNFGQGKVSINNGHLALEASMLLPGNSKDYPLLLRPFSGKEVGVYLELAPNSYNDEHYVTIEKAAIGKIPLPVNTLIALLPDNIKSSFNYTEHGIKLNSVINSIEIRDINISNKDLEIYYRNK